VPVSSVDPQPGADSLAGHPLARLFDPRGVAVVGASATPGKYGTILLQTLIEQGYAGGIHPVSPKGGELLGHAFLRSLDEAPGPIDVALVVRPAPECPAAVREVSERGIPFAIVYAAGFSEQGEEGRRLEAAMVDAAAAGGTRLVGPNGMNVFSAPARLNLSAIVPFPVGGLGFLSASGNLGYALAQEASRRGGVGFSRFISAGNQADIALDEYLDFLRLDPHTQTVLVYLEGFVRRRGRAFLDRLARTAAVKPVLVLRGGRTREGRATARSHTGALASESEVARSALEQAGAVLFDRADEALAMAQAFLDSPLPRGPRAALVGEGGGHATLIADAAAEAGLRVEPFPDALAEALGPHLPPFVAILRNPVEFGGRSEYDPRIYEKVLEPIFEWEGCEQVVLFGGYALYDEALAAFLSRRRRETGKPILVHDLYADEDRPAFAHLRNHLLPLFASAEVAARAGAALARGGRARARALATVQAWESFRGTAALPDDLGRSLAAARASGGALSEEAAASLLSGFGLPVLPSRLARDAEGAVAAAASLGYPVVLKIHSGSIVHKTDVGGVHVDLRNASDVRAAYGAVAGLAPAGRAEVRLTPFLRGGVETIVGARRDPEFGEVLLFGAGGVLAEVARDRSLRVLPCAETDLEEMVSETRVAGLLDGARGGLPADRAALVEALRTVARLILAVPEVADVEVNPLRCAPEGVVALDARVLLEPPGAIGSGAAR